MSNKAVIILVLAIVGLIGGIAILSASQKNASQNTVNSTPSVAPIKATKTTENTTRAQEEAITKNSGKELEFAVIRVLPSGFSPKEVTIKPGMIIRFTNPTEKIVNLKWSGDVQYTKVALPAGADASTILFDKVGTYTFTDSSNPAASGKVIVK